MASAVHNFGKVSQQAGHEKPDTNQQLVERKFPENSSW